MPKETRAPSLRKILGPMSRDDRASFLLRYAQLYRERLREITGGVLLTKKQLHETWAKAGNWRRQDVSEKPKVETLEDLQAEASWFGYRPHPDSDPTPRCLEDGEEEVREAEGAAGQAGGL